MNIKFRILSSLIVAALVSAGSAHAVSKMAPDLSAALAGSAEHLVAVAVDVPAF